MTQVAAPARAKEPTRPGARLGMRRVRWIRVVVRDGGEAVCHVMGTGHRLPTTRRVSLGTAMALAAEGVPCVVRCQRGPTAIGPSAS
jgi:hypothetical protein